MTLIDYVILQNAYRLKDEDEWDRTRNVMAAVMNFAGMGTKEPILPNEIIELSKDDYDTVKPITSVDEAVRMIDKM